MLSDAAEGTRLRLAPETIDRLLDAWPVARLASVAPDGRPHQVPIVFARLGDTLWSPVDAKPKAGGELARVRNLRARPAASLLLDAYDEDWSRLWWLRVDATARVVGGGDGPDEEMRSAAAALERKYPQYRTLPVLRDPPTLLAFGSLSVSSWCAGPEAARDLLASSG